jgi:DNA-binding transcriptional LysR family regulator
VQIGATEGIKAAALAGLGVAFLSRWSARNELALGQLRVLPMRDLVIRRDFSWALSAADPPGLAGRFLRFARLAAPTLAASR